MSEHHIAHSVCILTTERAAALDAWAKRRGLKERPDAINDLADFAQVVMHLDQLAQQACTGEPLAKRLEAISLDEKAIRSLEGKWLRRIAEAIAPRTTSAAQAAHVPRSEPEPD